MNGEQLTPKERMADKLTNQYAGWLGGSLVVWALTMTVVMMAFAFDAHAQDTAPIAIGSMDEPAVVAEPDFGFSASTLLRTDERGSAQAALHMPYAVLMLGGEGDFGSHDVMGVFGGLSVRVDDVAAGLGWSMDWTRGELVNFLPAPRLTWWPDISLGVKQPDGKQSASIGRPVALWVEYSDGAARIGVDAEGRKDWFLVGGSAWMDTAKTVGVDLYLGVQLDGLRLRIGGLYADAGTPLWWGRGRGDGEPSVYASIGWRG